MIICVIKFIDENSKLIDMQNMVNLYFATIIISEFWQFSIKNKILTTILNSAN